MAVVVQCFHCAHVLELDDGFRGGVCRCSQCGALLQVPKGDAPAPRAARAAAPVPRPVGKRSGASGTDIGISSGRLDPRNAPIGNYRGAADPGFSSGRLNPQGSGIKPAQGTRGSGDDISTEVTVDASVKIRPAEEAKARRTSVTFWVVIGLLVVVAVVIGVAALTVGL
jgi:hypothetical protein